MATKVVDLGRVVGADGAAGAAGKSAYQSAVEAGYTGTEAEFYAALVAMQNAPFVPTNSTKPIHIKSGEVKLLTEPFIDFLGNVNPNFVQVNVGTDLFISNLKLSPNSSARTTIDGVETPTFDFNAANKKYVDDAVANVGGDFATMEYLDEVKELLTSHLEKIATLTWDGITSGHNSVNIKLIPYHLNGSCQYKLSFRGGYEETVGRSGFVLSPPPGYAFTNLAYTFVPRLMFPTTQYSCNGHLNNSGAILFDVPPSQGHGDFYFDDPTGLAGEFALVCLEVA